MWYDRRGQGDPLVALHPGGAGVDSRALAPNVEALSQHFQVYTPEQRGHGHTPDVEGPITFELMAQDTITFIETVIGGPVRLLGCSDGAILALTIALRRPDLVRRLVFAAGVFHRDGWEDGVLDGDPPDFLRQGYGEVSPDGIGHYDVIVAKLDTMHAHEPSFTHDDLGKIACRTLVMVADDDQFVWNTLSICTGACLTPSYPSFQEPRTVCSSRNQGCATWSSPSSSPRTRYRHSRPSAAPPPGSRRTLQVG